MTALVPMLLAAWFFPGMPWLSSRRHHDNVAHAFASLVLLAVILALVAWAFRRKPN